MDTNPQDCQDCQDCQDALIDFVYDELDIDAHRAVSQHLTRCGACAVAFCRHREQLAGLSRAYAEAPGPGVREALRARVAREFSPPLWRRALELWTRPVPAYGVVVAACLPVVVWLFTSVAAPGSEGDEKPEEDRVDALDRVPRIIDFDASVVPAPDPGLL